MTDPMSAIAAAAGAGKLIEGTADEAGKAASSLWSKVLGPPAEALGTHLRSRIDLWSKDDLARRVLERASKKIDPSEAGTVPPRVASDIFDKAQWADDEFVAEYLSGVLASARSPEGDDDSGVTWTALVGRLSSAQLRLHYMLYSTARHWLLGHTIETINDLDSLPIFVPLHPVAELLGPGQQGADAFNEGIMNLSREGLIGSQFHIDTEGHKTPAGDVPSGKAVLIYRVTSAGVMLFLRGAGSRVTLIRSFSDPEQFEFAPLEGIPVPLPGSFLFSNLTEVAQEPEDSE